MIPERLSAYYSVTPLLGEISEWSLLRKWSLSEVYRVRLKSGESRIIKWGGKEMAAPPGSFSRSSKRVSKTPRGSIG